MAPKRDQLFSKDKFDAFMSDNDDEDYSVGSARGSIGGHSRLGGLGGLRPVNNPTGGGLGSLHSSPNKPAGSLRSSPGKPTLGGLGGLGSSAGPKLSNVTKLGGLGGLGGSKSGAPAAATTQLGNMKLGDTELANVLKSIASNLQGLSEKTIVGFQDVANRLNQEKGGDLADVSDLLDTLVTKIDETITAKKDEIYIIIPGHETQTLTTDETNELMKNKSVRVFGTIGSIATITAL